MIKTIQLLKESFTTYRSNFNKIFWIALPIVVLVIIGEYYVAVFTTMINNNNFSNIAYLFMSIAIYMITLLIVSLYFGPVLNRAIQKKEDDGVFDSKLAHDFQKNNIFKWIMVNVWGFLYMVRVMWLYIIISVLLLTLGILSKNVIIVSTAVIVTFLGAVLNITKFVLYKNIFFSKDGISARDVVRESIELGKTKNKEVWMLILTLIILALIMMVIYFVLSLISGSLGGTISKDILFYSDMIVSGIVSTLFFLPLMLIVAAKGYVKIRG